MNELTAPSGPVKAPGIIDKLLLERAELDAAAKQLSAREVSPLSVALAIEYDTRAKKFESEASKACELPIAFYHKLHREWTGYRNRLLAPAVELRAVARRLIQRFAEQQRKDHPADPADRAIAAERVADVMEGVSMTKTWVPTVTDLRKLVAHIDEHPELIFLLRVDEPALKDYTRRMRGNLALPGVTVEEKLIPRNLVVVRDDAEQA